MNAYDFAHTYDFHHIARTYGEGEPMMVTVRNEAGEIVALWPTLKRGIGTTGWFDLTSVYGYAGPLVADGVGADAALQLILDFMREEGAVSLFSRMHPLMSSIAIAAAIEGKFSTLARRASASVASKGRERWLTFTLSIPVQCRSLMRPPTISSTRNILNT